MSTVLTAVLALWAIVSTVAATYYWRKIQKHYLMERGEDGRFTMIDDGE